MKNILPFIIIAMLAVVGCNKKKDDLVQKDHNASDSIFRQLKYIDVAAINDMIRQPTSYVMDRIEGEAIFDTTAAGGERVLITEGDFGGAKSRYVYCFLNSDTLENVLIALDFSDLAKLKNIHKVKYFKNFSDDVFNALNAKEYYRYSYNDFGFDSLWSETIVDYKEPEVRDLTKISGFDGKFKRSIFWNNMDEWIANNSNYNGAFYFSEYYGHKDNYEDTYVTGNLSETEFLAYFSSYTSILQLSVLRRFYIVETPANKTTREALNILIANIPNNYFF